MRNHLDFRYEPRVDDVENVREIVTSTSFFQKHEVPVAVELVQERLEKGIESGYLFIFVEMDNRTIAYACYARYRDSNDQGTWTT